MLALSWNDSFTRLGQVAVQRDAGLSRTPGLAMMLKHSTQRFRAVVLSPVLVQPPTGRQRHERCCHEIPSTIAQGAPAEHLSCFISLLAVEAARGGGCGSASQSHHTIFLRRRYVQHRPARCTSGHILHIRSPSSVSHYSRSAAKGPALDAAELTSLWQPLPHVHDLTCRRTALT